MQKSIVNIQTGMQDWQKKVFKRIYKKKNLDEKLLADYVMRIVDGVES